MKNFFKSKFATFLVLLATIILAGIAVFTAIRLYNLRQEAVAPNAPTSLPRAQEATATPTQASTCTLSFSLATATATATATSTATATATSTATATPTETPVPSSTPNSCGGTCGSNTNCGSGLYCYSGFCRNPDCPTDTDCNCPSGTTTPTPTQASLPEAGTSLPSILGISAGTILLIISLALAL